MEISRHTRNLIEALNAQATEDVRPEQVVADLAGAINNNHPSQDLFNLIALIIQSHKEGLN